MITKYFDEVEMQKSLSDLVKNYPNFKYACIDEVGRVRSFTNEEIPSERLASAELDGTKIIQVSLNTISNFEKYMTPPIEYVPSEDDLLALRIIREVVEDGYTAQIKLDRKTKQLKVYQIDSKCKKRV